MPRGGRADVRKFFAATAAMMLAVSTSAVYAADIAGTVIDHSGAGVAGVRVSVENQAGKQIAEATSDAKGSYAFHDLAPGTYNFNLKGQSAVAYVPEDGLTINWGLAPNSPPVASARQGVAIDDADNSTVGAQK